MEIWKDIKGYEGRYQVSSEGRVRSFAQGNGRILKNGLGCRGYLHVSLSKGNIKKNGMIHKLVLDAFVPNTENKSEANHKNGIKTDNRLENLEWVTSSENHSHAFKNGLMESQRQASRKMMKEIHKKFPHSGFAKLNEDIVKNIRENRYGLTTAEFAALLEVNQSTISRIKTHQRW